jgi:hypothetical protein
VPFHLARKSTIAGALAGALALPTACSESGDYLAVAGGGFVFNYRLAEAEYGIALKPMRDLPADSSIETTFENPSGGEPFVIRKDGPFNPIRVAFDTPALDGVVKDRPYRVVVVLRDAGGATLQRIEKTFTSQLDQTALPERPLAIGPGYQKNIDGSTTAYPPSLSVRPGAERSR